MLLRAKRSFTLSFDPPRFAARGQPFGSLPLSVFKGNPGTEAELADAADDSLRSRDPQEFICMTPSKETLLSMSLN